MKYLRILASFLFTLSFVGLSQTVQNGFVMEYHGKKAKTPLAGVELHVEQANSCLSDKNGRFKLVFPYKNPFEQITYRLIKKNGFEIFNKDALKCWTINPKVPFTIVMYRTDLLDEERDRIRKLSIDSYEQKYKEAQKTIERLKADGKIKEQEYRDRMRTIFDNHEKQLTNLESYIDRFTHIDRSELSAPEQEIIELVHHGNIDEAIARYDALGIKEKLIHGLKQKQIADEISQSLNQNNEAYRASLTRQIETLQLQGDLQNNLKIANLYREVADVDTTNIEWLLNTGRYLQDYLADYDLALIYYNKALKNNRKEYNNFSYNNARTYFNIGSVYHNSGNHSKAIIFYKKALELSSDSLEETNDDFAQSRIDGFRIPSHTDYDINPSCENFFNIIPNTLGNSHFDISTLYYHIGNAYDMSGDYNNAVDFYRKALIAFGKSKAENDIDCFIRYNYRGLIHAHLNEFNEALSDFQSAQDIICLSLGMSHPSLFILLNNIGGVSTIIGNYTDALFCFNRALDIYKTTLGENHPNIAKTYNNIGLVYSKQSDHAKALTYFEKALHIQLSVLDESHPNIVSIYNNIGRSYYNLSDYDKALTFFDKVLALQLKSLNASQLDIASTYVNVGWVNFGKGDYDNALSSFYKAYDIYLKTYGPFHPVEREVRLYIDSINLKKLQDRK